MFAGIMLRNFRMRKDRNWSQNHVADWIGIPCNVLCDLERGRKTRPFTPTYLAKIEAAMIFDDEEIGQLRNQLAIDTVARLFGLNSVNLVPPSSAENNISN